MIGIQVEAITYLPAIARGYASATMIGQSLGADDRRRALQDCGIWAALALPGETKMGVDDPREMERLASELSIEKAAVRWLVSDDPDEHIEQIRPYIELGFTHLVFHSPGNNQSRFINAYARDILPRLRERWG